MPSASLPPWPGPSSRESSEPVPVPVSWSPRPSSRVLSWQEQSSSPRPSWRGPSSAAFLAGAFFATTFLAGAFLATDCFAGAFFAAAFFAGAFLAAAFFAGRLLRERPSSPVPSSRRPSWPEPSSRPPSWPDAFLAGGLLGRGLRGRRLRGGGRTGDDLASRCSCAAGQGLAASSCHCGGRPYRVAGYQGVIRGGARIDGGSIPFNSPCPTSGSTLPHFWHTGPTARRGGDQAPDCTATSELGTV